MSMDLREEFERLYKAIKQKAPVDKIVALATEPQLFSAKKWDSSESYVYDLDWGSALHCASYHNHIDLLQQLITHYNADVNQRTTLKGNTALHFASQHRNVDIVRFLIEKGADVNQNNQKGNTALHFASQHGNIDIVRFLIEKGSDVNCRGWNGNAALHFASQHGNIEIVRLLIEKGADVNRHNQRSKTALHIASQHGNTDVVLFLLEKGADLNWTSAGGDTALHLAVQHGKTDVVLALIEKGADLNQTNWDHNTALHLASELGNTDIVHLLIEKGAHVNCTGRFGWTPLHMVTRVYRDDTKAIPVLNSLLKSGANPAAKSLSGIKPAGMATTNAQRHLLKLAEAEKSLTHLRKVKPKIVRLAVLGDEAVGKTQFIETVTSYTITALVRSRRDPPAEGSDEYVTQRTPGIKIREIELSDGRIVRVLDMGGQMQFIASHRPIVVTGFGMYLLVLNLLVGEERMLKSGRYWIQFVISTRHPATIEGCLPPPLFVLFSHSDQLSSGNARCLASEVYARLKDEFDIYFEWMSGNPYIGNCRIRSSDITRLFRSFDVAHDQVTKTMPWELKINKRIRKALKSRSQSDRSSNSSGIVKLQDFFDFLRPHVPELLNVKDLAALTTVLDMQADVLLFDAKGSGQEATSPYVVMDPEHVCHHVLKVILSPRHFIDYHLVFPPHGVIEGPKLDEALKYAGVDPEVGKGLLCYSQICTPNQQPPNSYFFGIHVAATSGTWNEDGVTKPQSGLQVHSLTVPFSPAFLPALLLALSNKIGGIGEDTLVWKTGIVIPWENDVIVKVEQADGSFDVNLTARAEPDHLADCAAALAGVSDITLRTAKSVSGGSETELRYLSPSQVAAGESLTVAYTAEKVIGCYNERRWLMHGKVVDNSRDVMAVLRAAQPHLCPTEGGSVSLPGEHNGERRAEGACAGIIEGTDYDEASVYSCSRELKEDDPELFNIADVLVFDAHNLKRFAANLLQGSGCQMSVSAFLASLDYRDYATVPSKVHAVLQYWIRSAPPPFYHRYGGELKQVLQRIGCAAVAHDFSDYLGC